MREMDAGQQRLPRVLLFSPLPPPYGGIARWTRTIMDMDAETVGAELFLVNTAHRVQRSDDTPLAVRIVTGAGQMMRVWILFVDHLFRRGLPDCVHVNSSGSLGLIRDVSVVLACRLLRIRSVLHLRFGRTPELLRGRGMESRLLRRAVKLASGTISIDLLTYSAITTEIGPDRAVYIPNFIDTSKYEPRFSRASKTILFLGAVSSSKGIEELLIAWKALALEGWTLRLVGPISPGMEDRLGTFNADSSVEVLGTAEHHLAMEHLYGASFMVLPSHTEGFPNVVLEAMATGTPIIASAVGSIPQMLEGGAGVIFTPGDVDELKSSILLVAGDAHRRIDMARRAHGRVVAEYSTEAVVSLYRSFWML